MTVSATGQTKVAEIQAAVCQAAFGRRFVTNVLRGMVAEAIIEKALGPEWEWCSQDYSPWDFRRADGRCLEVKQSAARQSWATTSDKPSRGSFDIRERLGRWEGATWIAAQRRWADVYVFAHHARVDAAADHRDPDQWVFYVVPTEALPLQQTISLGRVTQLARPTGFHDLGAAVTDALALISA